MCVIPVWRGRPSAYPVPPAYEYAGWACGCATYVGCQPSARCHEEPLQPLSYELLPVYPLPYEKAVNPRSSSPVRSPGSARKARRYSEYRVS